MSNEQGFNVPIDISITIEAETAKNALNGRFFGGRRVIGEIYDFAMYKHNDLSG